MRDIKSFQSDLKLDEQEIIYWINKNLFLVGNEKDKIVNPTTTYILFHF